jgi:4-hydroxyphenylpyruvate dioxygenase
MTQTLLSPTRSRSNLSPFIRTDYIEFYVGNARQAAHYYCRVFGFKVVAYRGPETGNRDSVSYVLAQENIWFVLTASLCPDDPVARQVGLHGDGVRDIALEVDDVDLTWYETSKRGARGVRQPETLRDAFGEVRLAAIATYGDTIHTFVERKNYRGAFLPGFSPFGTHNDGMAPRAVLKDIDHVVANLPAGQMNSWVDFYRDVMGFELFQQFGDRDISTEYSALMSTVMSTGTGRIKFPLTEPAHGKRKSQIQEFLDFNRGPGVQHIAMTTDNIIETVRALLQHGADFLATPSTYYDDLLSRTGPLSEAIDDLRQFGILADADIDGYMLQIFTRPVGDRPTLFYEIIQRKGSESFGKGNFRALFEAIEREQALRGNL